MIATSSSRKALHACSASQSSQSMIAPAGREHRRYVWHPPFHSPWQPPKDEHSNDTSPMIISKLSMVPVCSSPLRRFLPYWPASL